MNKENTKIKYRYERKFVIPKYLIDDFALLKSFLKIELFEVFNSRKVNSIYYDSDDFQYAYQNIEGIADRKKIRIRYYGQTRLISNPQLEVKSKFGNVGSKFSLILNESELRKNQFNLFYLRDYDKFPQNLIDETLIIKPKILVSYKRRYFQSKCTKYRFTFDTDISFLFIEHINQLSSIDLKIASYANKNILEIKYDSLKDRLIDFNELNIPFRLTSNSKYLLGLYELGLLS